MYVDDLVAPHTVNTMPLATLEAVADHGTISGPTATHNPDETLQALERAGIDLVQVTDELLDAGVKQFEDAMSHLLGGIEERRKSYKGQG
jgi:transaldolase